jgi:hypothetical protein
MSPFVASGRTYSFNGIEVKLVTTSRKGVVAALAGRNAELGFRPCVKGQWVKGRKESP